MIMPKSKMATPANIVFKFGLTNKSTANTNKNAKKNNLLTINRKYYYRKLKQVNGKDNCSFYYLRTKKILVNQYDYKAIKKKLKQYD